MMITIKDMCESIRIDKYLSKLNKEYTRTYVQKLIDGGNILVNGKSTKASYAVSNGDEIEVNEPEVQDTEIVAQDIPLDIVYEDEDILVINKSKGMVVHPGNGNYTGTLVNAILYSHKDNLSGINGVIRPGIVHRIDKDTTGIIVVAKNDNAHKTLSEDFKRHDITRMYIALVRGIVDKDNIRIDLPIGRSDRDRKKMSVTNKNARNAVTNIKVLKRYLESGYTLVQANLETGRTHQIRVHMSYIGYPLVGDTMYSNGKNEFGVEGQLLHAKILGFKHPVTCKYMEFIQDIPREFQGIIDILDAKEM